MNLIEKSVLSGIVQYGEDALIDVSDLISIKSFTIQDNQLLYKILVEILKKNLKIDIPTIYGLAESLSIKSLIDKKNEYINSLFTDKIELANVRQHAKTLMKLELIRKSCVAHKEAFEKLKKLSGTETVEEILNISEEPLFDLINETFENNQPKQIVTNEEEYLRIKKENDGNILGLPTPFPKFNTVIGGGLRSGGVTLIGSRAGVGKSTFGKEVGLSLAEKQIPVLYIDTEMTEQEQLDRCVASRSEVNITDIETGSFLKNDVDKNKVLKILKEFKSIPLYHHYVGGKPFEEILSIIRRWIIKNVGYNQNNQINRCLVIYDYFKLMNDDKLEDMQEYQALGFQISKLTDFCKEYQFPCLSFVQLNRDGVDKESSATIAQSDRLVWLCLALAIFKPKTQEELAETGHFGNMKLIPLKTRFGSPLDQGDYINLYFNRNKSILTEGDTYFQCKKQIQSDLNEEWSQI